MLLNSLAVIIALCLYIIKPFKFVKLCIIIYSRIGHLAGNTDLFLRRLQLEKPTKDKKILYVGISGKPANEQLLRMFQRKMPILQNDFAADILNKSVLQRTVFCVRLPNNSNEYYEYNNTEPNLSFTADEENRGKELLSNMGIDNSSWFVCFHARDTVYMDKHNDYHNREDDKHNDYRNSDIKNYLEAAKYISSCDGYAVRMGYGVLEELPDLNNPRIIDYASYHQTDFGDIYLPAKCKYFLASPSGLWGIPLIFHVPVVCVNFIHFHTPLRKGDLFIPKKVWSIDKKRFLTFLEILEFEGGVYQYSEYYTEAGLEVIENTAEEILDVAQEMNERLNGTYQSTEEDEDLQNRFHNLFQPHHIVYGTPARVGARFLRQNKELLE